MLVGNTKQLESELYKHVYVCLAPLAGHVAAGCAGPRAPGPLPTPDTLLKNTVGWDRPLFPLPAPASPCYHYGCAYSFSANTNTQQTWQSRARCATIIINMVTIAIAENKTAPEIPNYAHLNLAKKIFAIGT